MTDVVDQPAEVGFSVGTVPMDNDQVTAAFYSWLKQFYTTFPNLRKKNLHIMGESWGISIISWLMIAGIYVPYFANIIQKNQKKFPVNLKAISVGNPILGNNFDMNLVASVPLIVCFHFTTDRRPSCFPNISMARRMCFLQNSWSFYKTSLKVVVTVMCTENLWFIRRKGNWLLRRLLLMAGYTNDILSMKHNQLSILSDAILTIACTPS